MPDLDPAALAAAVRAACLTGFHYCEAPQCSCERITEIEAALLAYLSADPRAVEIERLTGERDRWQEDSMRQAAAINRMASAAEDRNEVDVLRQAAHDAEIAALRAQVEQMREALEFYANPEIYKPHPHGPAFDRRDMSFKARAALSAAPKPGEGA